jgi:hypothetical protein
LAENWREIAENCDPQHRPLATTIFLIHIRPTRVSCHFSNILAQALLELHKKENVTEAPSNCNASGALWQTGKTLFEYIRNQV